MNSKDSTVEIEEILRRKVDIKTVKDFLGTNQHQVAEENFSSFSSQQPKKQPFELKQIKVNLIDEYKTHLQAVNKMQNFVSMKMYMDHTFFKLYMPEEIISNQGTAFDFSPSLNDEQKNISLNSTIEPTVHSFLEPQQEALIPSETQEYPSTTALFSLLHELKGFLEN